MSFILGITGGIATGKSTAVAHFRQLGFPIVDADLVARAVVRPKTPGLKAVIDTFGPSLLNEQGALDREALGKIIFADEEKRKQLNQLLSPFIRQEILRQIAAAADQPLVVVDIPLLYEAGYEQYMDQVAVVYVPEIIQKQRLMLRNQLSETEAAARIASQLSSEKKKVRGDIIFDNQGTITDLTRQIDAWVQHFQETEQS